MRRLSWLLLASITTAYALPTYANNGDAPVLLAQKRKAKKKKKAKDDETDFGPGDIDAVTREQSEGGIGIHHVQEGIDTPYLMEASGLTSLSLLTSQSGDGDPAKSTTISIDGELVFILGSFGVGPALTYITDTTTATVTTTDPVTTASTSTSAQVKTTALGLGPVFKMYFGNVNASDLVAFAYGAFEYQMGSSKAGDADEVKSTGSQIRVGGGINFFLDSNVTFQPRAQYLMRTSKPDTEGADQTKTSGIEMLLGLGVFL